MIKLSKINLLTRMPFLVLLTLLLSAMTTFAQRKFDPELLKSPKTNGALIADKLITTEVFEYKKSDENCVILKNGFRQSTFLNASDWTSIKDTVKVERVEIVYSKYPIRGGIYYEIYPLLFNRIKATIALDPDLNDEKIQWNKVWQTNCVDNAQVDGLYHGVVIWYSILPKDVTTDEVVDEITDKPNEDEEVIIEITDNPNEDEEVVEIQEDETKIHPELVVGDEEKYKEDGTSVDFILKSPHLPDSIRQELADKPLNYRISYLHNYFISLETEDGSPKNKEIGRLQYLNEVNFFLTRFPDVDPVILKVLDRHPEWENKIVVNDWTGSMYGYGAQVVEWHLLNIDSSGISSVTLFNDGDKKSTQNKKIGSTGGIYTETSGKLPELLDLFQFVISKGGGGDSPENDVEAILEAIEDQPASSEIILIADNNACVRDIELASQINRPVRIILCGFDPRIGVNAHYVYLAKITGGGIYTIDDDFEEIQVTLADDGSIDEYYDARVKLIAPQCYSGDVGKISSRNFTLKQARWHKKSVQALFANNSGIKKLPSYVYKLENMQSLNANHNNLSLLSNDISKLTKLSSIDFSHNGIPYLPEGFAKIKYLESLNLSHNNFDTLPEEITHLKFLKILDISNNTISEFKTLETKLLTHLNLSNNELTEIPSLKQYSQLLVLDLSGNKITSLPTYLTLPKSLTQLSLANNGLTSLPDDLSDYADLKILDLSGNDFSWAEQDRIRQMLFYTDLRF